MAPRGGERRNVARRVLIHFETTLGAGLLVVLPLVITFWVVKFFFDLVDPLLQDTVLQYLPGPHIPGMGVLIVVALIYVAGWFTTHGLGRRLISAGHRLVESIPAIGGIYSPLRSAFQMLSDGEDQPYRGVVLVEFPRRGAKSIGLITSYLGETDGEDMVAIYVPTTPVPSSGFLIVVPSREVTPTEITVEDAMKIIISGGLLAGAMLGEPDVEVPALPEREHD